MGAANLCVTWQLLFALLLVVLGVRILSSSNSCLINFNTGMPVLQHHSPLSCSFPTIFS